MADSKNEFKKQLEVLEKLADDVMCKSDGKSGWCMPIILIACALFPVILGFGLYYFNPGLVNVTDKKTGQEQQSKLKVFGYTFLATAILWLMVYFGASCAGYDVWGMLCFR